MAYRVPLIARNIGHRLLGSHHPDWFAFRNRVDLRLVSRISDASVPDGDAVIATWCGTAYDISRLPKCKGAKYYLIQGHEIWDWDETTVHESYKLGLSNIVIARWLGEAVERAGGRVAATIPNGMNSDLFRLSTPIESRDPLSVAMLYHEGAHKGSEDGIRALEIIRKRYPNLAAGLFSVYRRPSFAPDWIKFVRNPRQAELVEMYNRHAIFISPSLTEGWPLPPAEAMLCGSAVCATDIAGHREYAIDGDTALLSPPKNPEALAANTVRLLQDRELRIGIATRGHAHIQQYTWDRAVAAFEQCLSERPE